MSLKTSTAYNKLQAAERKGDLKGQYDLLRNALVETRFLERNLLKEALDITRDQASQAIPPFLVAVLDQQSYTLQLLHNISGEKKFTIPLPQPENSPDFDAIEWTPAGQLECSVFTVRRSKTSNLPELEIQTQKNPTRQPKYGLSLSSKYPYLNINDLDKYLANSYTENYLWGYSAQNKVMASPLEMAVSFTGGKIAVADRSAGCIYLVDAMSQQITKKLEIREPGHSKRIHMTFSTDKQFLYVTDNESNRLFQFNALTGQQQVIDMDVPMCGNLMYSRSQNVLYLLALNPENKSITLCQCDPSGNIQKQIPLKGEPFSLAYDPGDLMTMTLSGNYAAVMTSTDQPVMYTPLLNLIDLEAGSVVNSLPLQYNQKPMNLAMRAPQSFPPNTSIRNTLLEKGLLDRDKFNQAMGIEEEADIDTFYAPSDGAYTGGGSSSQNQEKEGEAEQAAAEVPEGMPMGGGGPASAQRKQAHEGFQKLNAAKVEKHIYEQCVNHFANKTKIQLTEEEYPSACDRLRTACTKARNDLLYDETTLLKVTSLVDEHDLEVELSRNTLMGAVQAEETKPTQQFQAVCQECGRPMPPQGDCPICHPPEDKEEKKKGDEQKSESQAESDVQLDSPHHQKKTVPSVVDKMLAKKAPLSREEMMAKLKQRGLAGGQKLANMTFLICDRTRNQVAEVDREKQVIWKFGGFGSPPQERLSQPIRAEKTPVQTVLIADSGNGRVLEVSKEGNDILQIWSDHFNAPQSALKLPNGNILVADHGQILELSTDDQIVWQIQEGMEEPAYVMRLKNRHILITDKGRNRVVELDTEGQECWVYENSLKGPEQAKKLGNGNVLIADTGNNRVIEVTPESHIVWEFNGKPQGGMHLLFKEPTHVFRLKSGNTIILHSGQRKALELAPDISLVWQNAGTGLLAL